MKKFLFKLLAGLIATFALSLSPMLVSASVLSNYYINVYGNRIHTPVKLKEVIPVGATAKCKDGSYSFSQTRRGTCSHHAGVLRWLR